MDLLSQAVDLDERKLYQQSPDILKLLLKDRTTKRHIVWGTSSYEYLGKGFESHSPITVRQLTTYHKLIQPRSEKTRSEQKARTKVNAEVFTPTWLVKKQTDFAEEDLLDLSLEDYIDQRWLEITCGEAPYIVTRYDAVSGELLPLSRRVGFLDRKLARISEAVASEGQWLTLVKKAYQASYGYEWQGDSLLLARENLLLTFEDYYEAKFAKKASLADLKEIATIISYNLFQMDGLNHVSPSTDSQAESKQLSLFDDIEILDKVEIKTQIKNWKTKKMLGFERLASGENEMKFDVVIGNPPYQEELQGTSDKPIYNYFIDSSIEIAERSCLITPARFLFNAGKTPKAWNKKMLSDLHFKVNYYQQDSSKVFAGTDIKGGVAITYCDRHKEFGAIETFTAFSELNSIYKKVYHRDDFKTLSDYVYAPESYKLTNDVHEDYPEAIERLSKGHKYDVTTNIFEKLPEIFTDEKIEDNSIRMIGRLNNERVYKYVPIRYIKAPDNLEKYKIILPKANGSGKLGEALSNPIIGNQYVGHTQTFISIGNFNTEYEAENCLKYIKTKFVRALLSVKKITQDNKKASWFYVPWQDFSENSDIDWSKSIYNIDQQLYLKYNLSAKLSKFIEENCTEMD